MSIWFKSRTVIVTGAAHGFGRAIAMAFAAAGARVYACDINAQEVAETARLCGAGCQSIILDVSEREAVQAAVAEIAALGDSIDILVNNAGMNVPQAIDAITDESWDQVVEVNLSSCMALTRALVPQMKERGWGRIIHISSIMGLASKPARDAYSATKAALIGLARANALELGTSGITVNCLAPGPFLTDMPGSLLSDAEKKVFADRTALERWGDPRELAGPALLLASEAGSYITGETLVVDGGTLCKTF